MANRKIDNLTPDSSASDMEQALVEYEVEQTSLKKYDKPKLEVKEAYDDLAKPDTAPVEEAVEEKTETSSEKEAVEETPLDEAPAQEIVEEKPLVDDETNRKAKSYDDLRPWVTRMSQELAEMKKGKQAPLQAEQPAQPTMTQEQLAEWYERDPITVNRWMARAEATEQSKSLQSEVDKIKRTLTGSLAQNTVGRFRSQYQDFAGMEEDIKAEVAKLPPEVVENPQYFDTCLETAYWTVKGKRQKSTEEKAREQGRREAKRSAQVKKEAYVEGSGKSTPEQPFDAKRATSREMFEYMKTKGLVPELE